MNIIIVGGNFGDSPKKSSIVSRLSENLGGKTINGGTINELCDLNIYGYDLVIWTPNIDNSYEKQYPKKDNGAVLICSKVLRENGGIGDAVARIFKMNANAVIAIDKTTDTFNFKLIDALGNLWVDTNDIQELSMSILRLSNWTKKSVRIPSKQISAYSDSYDVENFVGIVKIIADKVENERGGRYFGNASTRCAKMFPTQRMNNTVLVSARNTNKDRLTSDDFVLTRLDNNTVYYCGDKKPSVDTPIQLSLYAKLPNINYIIHGHAYIDNADFTNHYYPCGDMREVNSVLEKININTNQFVLNLKNHGFVIGSNSLKLLEKIANESKFSYRSIGNEKIIE